MYCTGGIRCERASALLDALTQLKAEGGCGDGGGGDSSGAGSCSGDTGGDVGASIARLGSGPSGTSASVAVDEDVPLETEDVIMVRGGIERYLKTFPEGGHWKGKNYLFDRRQEQVSTACASHCLPGLCGVWPSIPPSPASLDCRCPRPSQRPPSPLRSTHTAPAATCRVPLTEGSTHAQAGCRLACARAAPARCGVPTASICPTLDRQWLACQRDSSTDRTTRWPIAIIPHPSPLFCLNFLGQVPVIVCQACIQQWVDPATLLCPLCERGYVPPLAKPDLAKLQAAVAHNSGGDGGGCRGAGSDSGGDGRGGGSAAKRVGGWSASEGSRGTKRARWEARAAIAPASTRLFVGNLPFVVSASAVRTALALALVDTAATARGNSSKNSGGDGGSQVSGGRKGEGKWQDRASKRAYLAAEKEAEEYVAAAIAAATANIGVVRWITDAQTSLFYGSAYVQVNSLADAAAVVRRAASAAEGPGYGLRLGKRRLRVCYAPPRADEAWPPPEDEREFPPPGRM